MNLQMSKQLSDLFKDFLTFDPTEQVEKIRQIRHTRTIERPKSAIKRQKKAAKKSDKNKGSITGLAAGMTEEEKVALLKMLEEE